VLTSRRKTESSSITQISRVICVGFCRSKDGENSLVFNTEGKYTMVKCSIKNLGRIRGSNSRKNNSVSPRYSRMASKWKSPSTHWDILIIFTAIFPRITTSRKIMDVSRCTLGKPAF
jgi:hypothetical protein